MFTIDRVLEEVVQERGPLVRGQQADPSEYQQVWDAFNRYVTATLEKRQTLDVPNFCKIGWRVEQFQDKTRHRPHFQFAETFLRVHQLDADHQLKVPDSQFTQIEDLNYSKAAIRYSQGLTKANIFTGLRAILHKIGDACTRQQVSIDFETGQLLCSERTVQFAFASELYLREGLEVPRHALTDVAYRPSHTFGAPPPEAFSLGVRGRGSGASVADSDWSSAPSPRTGPRPRVQFRPLSASSTGLESSAPPPSVGEASDEPSYAVRDERSAMECVRQDALERHLEEVTAHAEEAILQKQHEEKRITCHAQEENSIAEARRAQLLEHREHLKRQMQQAEEKRRKGREHAVSQASEHNFPNFHESVSSSARAYIGERKLNLKEDLDQQVSQKSHNKNASKLEDQEHAAKLAEIIAKDVRARMAEENAKKDAERKMLAESWNRSTRLKQVQQAIDSYHMTANAIPSAKSDLPGFSSGGLQAKTVPPLPLPEKRLDTSGTGASARPPTGSVRRVPFGASASLALRRDNRRSSSARR